MGAAYVDLHPLDNRAAAVAGLAGAAEHLDVHLHAAGLTVRVGVVPEAGAAALDARQEDVADGPVQLRNLLVGQRRAEASRVDARRVAGLVGVDVAYAGDAAL